MRPTRIEMKGFGAFRDATVIDLADVDLMALTGATGSGKSTIIDAITFALYGSVARYDDAKVVGYVISQLSPEARVSLTFELDGVEHVAVRVVRRTKSGATTKEARLERGESVLADAARPMTKAVADLLGLTFDQFNRTVVLPQGRFADFLHDEPRDRQATLRQLLGFDVYKRIGEAARARQSRLADQLAVLRTEAAADAEQLTDSRRAELERRVHAIGVAREQVATARLRHDELVVARTELAGSVAEGEARLQRLASVVMPDDVEEVAALVTTAEVQLADAELAVKAAAGERDTARAAVAAGPDLTAVSLQLQHHEHLVDLRAQSAELSAAVAALAESSAAATERAEAIRATQSELDASAEQATSDERTAREEAAAVPTVDQLDSWAELHRARSQAEHELGEAKAAAEAANGPLERLQEQAAAAEQRFADAEAELRLARDRHGVVAFAHLLAEGEACPLCQQQVRHVPEHAIVADLAAAEAHRAEADEQRNSQQKLLEAARQAFVQAVAHVSAAERAFDRAVDAVERVAPATELAALRAEAVRLADAEKAASKAAAAAAQAAKRHRDDRRHQQVLATAADLTGQLQAAQGQLTELHRQIADTEGRLIDAPSRDECQALKEQATRLGAARDEAERMLTHAERARDDKVAVRRAAHQRLDSARTDLSAARDRLAALDPPPIGGLDLISGWTMLVEWCRLQRDQLTRRVDAAKVETQQLDGEISQLAADARQLAGKATGVDTSRHEIAELGELLAAREATARSDVERFDERLASDRRRQEQIDALESDEAVARLLGHLLRSDAFEAWLMQSALQQLVGRATGMLFELSGGQYSLVVDDNEFLVRDHTNADETRSTRTLSGGETFLASLSLALALSEATAELAPEGAPHMESIFLDEGFGTLDVDTLDTVAGAIEELGASGRMVGIITHIRDLADRMPVRLEVTKAHGVSTVVKVEA